MVLLPEKLKKRLPPLYSNEDNPDPVCVVKFFHPMSSWSWYAYEYDPEDRMFFGWVDGDFPELGYFSLDELESVRVMGLGVERDMYWEPRPLSEVMKEAA